MFRGGERVLEDDLIQSVLGLPEVDRKETRRKLLKVFAVYRRWKRQMENGEDPDVEVIQRKPVPGYDNAMDPELIRNPNASHGSIGSENPHTRRIRRFVNLVERKVDRLPLIQAIIIEKRYLSLETPLPQDCHVFDYLEQRRLVFSEREYHREKAEALVALGDAMDVLVFRVPQ